MAFIFVERLLYVYYSRPHEQLSEQVKQLMRIRRYWDGLRLLHARRAEQSRLIVRSVVFMAVWVPMAIFVITSTGSMLASGLVMSIGLHLLYDVLLDIGNVGRLKSWLFWPIQREITDAEVKAVVGVYGGFFLLVTWMVV